MKLLVTGGAGYIGSLMTRRLLDEHHDVIVVDTFVHGHADAVDARAELIQGDIGDHVFLNQLFSTHAFDGVFHFAGVISMAESMKDPAKYFRGNTHSTLSLLEAMVAHTVSIIIFSSTAGVYGDPDRIPIPEDHPTHPNNPYGESKLMTEHLLHWFSLSHGLKYTALRYFNAAGASLDGKFGERHKEETHIIPLAIRAIRSDSPFNLYGDDYDTKDGTCVRDYIHVEDLCRAHLLALEYLSKGGNSSVFNVGTGKGNSNKEIIQKIEKMAGKKLQIAIKPRRPGDANALIADPSRIQEKLSWKPEHSSLDEIIETAWKFHTK